MRPASPLALVAASWLVAGCLAVPELNVSGYFSCEEDADCPDDWTCWERTDGSQRCVEVVECQTPDDAVCDDGEVCTADRCDMDRAVCVHPAAKGAVCAPGGCDAGAVYTPPSRCNAIGDCVASDPVACYDPAERCADQGCDADRGGCFAIPDLGLDCGVAGTWHGLFTRIDNTGSRDFRVIPTELELDAVQPPLWRFETTPGDFGSPNAIAVTALSSGEMQITDLDTALWLNVTSDREVIAGWDYGSVGPILFVRAPDEAPPADGLAGRWRAFLVNRRDDPDTVRSRMFDTFAGPLELADSGETACVATGGATLAPSGAPADPAVWHIGDGACAALGADGGFNLQHAVDLGEGGSRQERWRGWLTPGRGVGVAVREVEDDAGGFAAASGFVILVRESEDMPESGLDGAYAFTRLRHNVITQGTAYCWGQAQSVGGVVSGGVEVCNNTSETCEWRDRAEVTGGALTTTASGGLTARVFTGEVVTELFGQAAPLDPAVHAAPIAIGQLLQAEDEDGAPVARAGSLELWVWQPPDVAPREAPLDAGEDPWCPPVSD